MALGGRMNLYQALESPTFMMRVLLSLIPLLLVAWNANNTEALPIQEKLPNSNEVSPFDHFSLNRMHFILQHVPNQRHILVIFNS